MLAYIRRVCLWSVLTLVLSTLAASVGQAHDVQAIAGEPFGVGKMTIQLEPGVELFLDSPRQLVDRQGRVLYPAFEGAGVPNLGRKKPAEDPRWLTVYFLFRGDGPLKLDLQTDRSHRATVKPIADQAAHADLLAVWWDRYAVAATWAARSNSYPPLVEQYLTVTLARRLGLEPPKRPRPWRFFIGSLDELLTFFTGTESLRPAAEHEVLHQSTEATQKADRPLPGPIALPPLELPEVAADVAVEPIALHVPAECFYIRCGSFDNLVWLRRAIDDWGAGFRNLASSRGLDYRIMPRIERQLALRETVMAKLLGEAIISDVVVLGTDALLHEGAAVGVLFEAGSPPLLKRQIAAQRQEALDREQNARRQTVRIAGHEVSLLSTPGNRVRSFYAIDGKYHLVTTSRTLVERFYEAGRGRRSLGGLKEFRWARSVQPLAADHAVFVYLSDPFFRRMICPEHWIEMARRVRAGCEIDAVRLARLAARAEGSPATTVQQLVEAELLPKRFLRQRRPDGSRLVLSDGRVTDSLRGARGSFLPVPDVPITAAMPSEVAAYQELSRQRTAPRRRIGPVIMGIQRRTLDGGAKQRVTFDASVSPYDRDRYRKVVMIHLDAADKQRWANVPGDVASLEVNLLDHKYAAGLRDAAPEHYLENGRVRYPDTEGKSGLVTTTPFYVSCRKGGLDRIFPDLGTKPTDEDGDVEVGLLLNGWLRRLGDSDLMATNKQTLDDVAPHVKLVEAGRAANVRVRIADVHRCKLAAASNAAAYVRSRKISAGNVAMMHVLAQQLHVPAEDARATAERLLGARMVCPLGGRYELSAAEAPFDHWHSTAWQNQSRFRETQVPADYRAAEFGWFAGLSLEVNVERSGLTTHLELDVRAKQP